MPLKRLAEPVGGLALAKTYCKMIYHVWCLRPLFTLTSKSSLLMMLQVLVLIAIPLLLMIALWSLYAMQLGIMSMTTAWNGIQPTGILSMEFTVFLELGPQVFTSWCVVVNLGPH